MPVRQMNFNSRRRIEFVKSFYGGGRNENGKKASVTGLENGQREVSDGSFLLKLNEKKKG